MNCDECVHCYEAAMKLEYEMERFYYWTAELFPDQKGLIEVMLEMAKDEVLHRFGLEKVIESDKHSEAVHAEIPKLLPVINGHISEFEKFMSSKPENFEEIYDFINREEQSEVNTTFIFLMSEFLSGEKKIEIVRSNIEDHINKLSALTKLYDLQARKTLKPAIGLGR